MKTLACSALIIISATVRAGAVDISTYSSAGCAFPDTSQSVSYTATFGEDHDYASSVSTVSFTIYNPVGVSSVTVDNRTGLMWVTDPGADAGFNGAQTWLTALTSCTVTLNGMTYAGYTDWRLPNARELMSILDYGIASGPRINAAAFPNTVLGSYWTSTTQQGTSIRAWLVNFGDGSLRMWRDLKTVSYNVRCVRGGP